MDDKQEEDPTVWLLIDAPQVPEEWRDRARPLWLVPLLAGEAGQVLRNRSTEPLNQEDPDFLRQVARGAPAPVMARRLGLSTRSVHRRLARLRTELGLRSTAELSAELARRGF